MLCPALTFNFIYFFNLLQTVEDCYSTFPVRKLKGVFIDPVGMGNNFPFKNLHKFIAGQKTYTRSDDIREQLRKLTEHIEQVLQNYLGRNYESIEDYNIAAKSVA